MHSDYLGDAYDLMKRAVLDILRRPAPGVLGSLAIVPMITESKWTKGKRQAYESLLGLQTGDQVLSWESYSWGGRAEYLSTLKTEGIAGWDGDILADPDTGVQPSASQTEKHFPIDWFSNASMLPAGSKRLLVVYQHTSRGTKREDVKGEAEKRNKRIRKAASGVFVFSYAARSGGAIVACRDEGRLKAAKKRLQSVLKCRSSDLIAS